MASAEALVGQAQRWLSQNGVALDEGTILTRGQEALVWVNPLEPLVAYVAEPAKDGSWRYLGTAPVLAPSHQDDPEGVAANLKIRAKIQALERREILPWAEQRAAAKRADDAWNARLLETAKGTKETADRADCGQIEGSAAADGTARVFGNHKGRAGACAAPTAPAEAQGASPRPAPAGAGLSGATMDDLI